MRKSELCDGAVWDIESIRGFTMATTAAVKNLPDVVKMICCKIVDDTMTEEQMRPEFARVLQGKDQYGNTVMHYFALRKNDAAMAELLRVGGCMCIRNYAGQSAIDVRKEQKLRMLDEAMPFAVGVFDPSTTGPRGTLRQSVRRHHPRSVRRVSSNHTCRLAPGIF